MEKETFTAYGGQRGGGKIFHLEQMLSLKCAQLKETEIDRDRWQSAALYYRNLYNNQRSAVDMTFGDALVALKQGERVARKGWNGKNQYVELACCISYVNSEQLIVNVDHKNIGNKALAFVGTSGVQMGWLASQADMLAEDWYIVE